MNESKMSYLLFIVTLLSFIILNNAYATRNIGCYYFHDSERKIHNNINTSLNLKFKFNEKINLTISSWQGLYSCEGDYTLKEITAGFSASIVNELHCKIPSPQFFISNNENGYLIKSESLTNNDSYQLIECIGE